MPHTTRSQRRELLIELFADTLRRLDPSTVTAAAVRELELPGELTLIAAGKAAYRMTWGALNVLGPRVVDGCIVPPQPAARPLPDTIRVVPGSHPVPSSDSVRAGEALLAAVRSGRPVLALISGGASALACVPAPGLSLDEKLAITSAVMRSGAPIGELNTVRKHLSAIKGGQLAVAARGPVMTLALSDVIGDRLSDIASGPTVADPTTVADAERIVAERVGWSELPDVRSRLVETPKHDRPGDSARVIAGTGTLLDRAVDAAVAWELPATIVARELAGDVHEVAGILAAALPSRADGSVCCLIAGGEPTIRVPPNPGTGGRAQHLALLLARHLRGRGDVTILVAGSDGIDGNSYAAGAIVDGTTWDEIADHGGDPATALARADSHTALALTDATLQTGPTGVNHADLIIMLTHAR